MSVTRRASTGIAGLDQVIDMLRLGDNVVWQVESIKEYLQIVRPYIRQAKQDGRRLVYFRFGIHEPLMAEDEPSVVYELDPSEGFESFATQIHNIIAQEGLLAFYVFDCLSDLLEFWCSDMMIGNFFRVTCPFLFQLDTIAYFALIRGVHTHDTIARIRGTTQLLLDVYHVDDKTYIHPLKVWERYSPTMFFPHQIEHDKAVSITSSADAAKLFSKIDRGGQPRDYWDIDLERAHALLGKGQAAELEMKKLLIGRIIGKEARITELALRYFSLGDILEIAARQIGTGFIGGKSVGMLLARKILECEAGDLMHDALESHDSYYLGSDIFYTYIVQNGWWELRTQQKTPEGYFALAKDFHEKLLEGKFPDTIKEHFMQMLEHFGQSPIIVRSSSLQEDNFGNAFAGKYESVFCANQGSPEERYDAFEQAVRRVYASVMNDDALAYRHSRGLTHHDEQMAILVQRVSGDHHGELFFPHLAGVGNSSNLYVWNKDMDPNAGMLRMVFGLGTRAVDRVSGDYARIVPLDHPTQGPPVNYGDEQKFSQRKADVLNLRENRLTDVPLAELACGDLKTDKSLFFTVDFAALQRFKELGFKCDAAPQIPDFKKLLTETSFPEFAGTVLKTLEKTYDYPVDIEFTLNINPQAKFYFNLVQCRPLQTKGLGRLIKIKQPKEAQVMLSTTANFMGGNVRVALDYVVLIKTQDYLALSERDKYQVARLVGEINKKLARAYDEPEAPARSDAPTAHLTPFAAAAPNASATPAEMLKGKNALLIGPGRWGTTTPSLGIPVSFSELSNMAAICELSYPQAGLMPELSFGSHFFQDIVESDIFYIAVFDKEQGAVFHPEHIVARENLLEAVLPGKGAWSSVIHIAKTPQLILHSDVKHQKLVVFWDS